MSIDIVKDLGTNLQKEIAPGQKMKTIQKEDLRENLVHLKERFVNFSNVLNNLSANDRKTVASAIFKASSDRNNIACNTYADVAKMIGKNDIRIAFDSIGFVTLNYIKIIDALDRMITTAFKDKAITVYNTKLSHVAIFGLINEAELFINYATYLFDGVNYELCQHNGVRELPPPKKYRQAKLQKDMAEFVEICKNRLSSTSTAIASEIEKVRQNLDVNLIGDDNAINTGFINIGKISPMIRNILGIGARKFFIFRWLGEQWQLLKYARYQKAKKEKEWLEAHVALLKLDLQGADPNSEEYRKLVKVIESYNEMIAELDQKIDAYMNED